MGKDHIWDSTKRDRETRPKDHRIQHSRDRKTRSKDHIWAKTIYGTQHGGTRKPDPKTIGFNTVGTGKPDPKTIYGQRPLIIYSWFVYNYRDSADYILRTKAQSEAAKVAEER